MFVSLAQHKTTDNIKANKAFTIAFATKETVELADYFGIVSGNDEDKFAKAKVEFEKGKVVNAPIIKQFPVVLECELVSLDDGNLVGKIVNTSVDPRYVVDNKVDTSRIDFVIYDMTSHSYRVVGKKVATAFSCGRKFGK
ncbi:MAG: flavin reductase [Mycoplasmoidaceae bacterium]|nr:flavin reductase [Mycoplasmoidaceae bacterium]